MRLKSLLIVGIMLILCSCSAPAAKPQQDQTGVLWPTKDWQVSTPEEQGLDPAILAQMQTVIKDKNLSLQSLLIIRNGKIVSETYYAGQTQSTKHAQYSVTKSFISTLAGIAIDQGKLSGVEKRVYDLLPEESFDAGDAEKSAMTLENLLTMTSGLDWQEGDPIYNQMYRSDDWVKLVMDIPMAGTPGKKFVYCSGCSHVISAIVQQAVGQRVDQFAQKNLFDPLGIKDLYWEADRQGIPIGGWGLNLTPRDMAKLGYLYLHNGAWEGKQIVSSSWVKAATTKKVDTGGNLGYGYQWWIYPTHGAYAALGRFGQTIFVAPDLNLIVVTTASSLDSHDPVFNLIDNYILKAVKE